MVNAISVHVKIQFACLVTLLKDVLIAHRPLGSFSVVIPFAYFAELSTTIARINLQIQARTSCVLVLIFKWEPICHEVVHKIKSQE